MHKNDLALLIEMVLTEVDLYSIAAHKLLMGTAAQESALGKYVWQKGGGPALGIFQIEPATYYDMLRYLNRKSALRRKILTVLDYSDFPEAERLVSDIALSIIIARVKYYTKSEPLPAAGDIDALAAYWKLHYNTPLGAGSEEEFVWSYEKHCI